jgi:hypothetical protein
MPPALLIFLTDYPVLVSSSPAQQGLRRQFPSANPGNVEFERGLMRMRHIGPRSTAAARLPAEGLELLRYRFRSS